MSDPFLGQLKMFAGNFAPVGWQMCDGTLLSIAGNDALFQLLGTSYGGDGINTFGVPDLRGRVPIGPGTDSAGNVYVNGTQGGSESVTVVATNLPAHRHDFVVSSDLGTAATPNGNFLGSQPDGSFLFRPSNPTGTMPAGTISTTPGGLPHENRQPYLALNYIIATAGIYPSQS